MSMASRVWDGPEIRKFRENINTIGNQKDFSTDSGCKNKIKGDILANSDVEISCYFIDVKVSVYPAGV